MVSDEATATLRSMLVDAGVSLGAPAHDDIERTWTVLRRFADLEHYDHMAQLECRFDFA